MRWRSREPFPFGATGLVNVNVGIDQTREECATTFDPSIVSWNLGFRADRGNPAVVDKDRTGADGLGGHDLR